MIEEYLAGELPDNAPFWSPQVSLGMIINGMLYASHKKGEKAQMLRELLPQAQMVIATWHGQYRSDLFRVPLARSLDELESIR